MAYAEGIDFLDLPLGGVDWFSEDIQSPWVEGGAGTWHTGDMKGAVELNAMAREFRMGEVRAGAEEVKIVYDVPDLGKTEGQVLKCVVVGRQKAVGKSIGETTHYVLLITPKGPLSPKGDRTYERVGVGSVAGKFIDLEGWSLVKVR